VSAVDLWVWRERPRRNRLRHTPFRVIAEYFALNGYAVLRCDDRGVGESTGNASEQDFEGAVGDVVTTFRWLVNQPTVNEKRIILFGHSEGGLLAASAGQLVGAHAVIMLAGPAVPIEWILHEQARMISVEAGATPDQIAHERRMNERVFALSASLGHSSDVEREIEHVIRAHLVTWPDVPVMDEATVSESARTMASVVMAPGYRTLLRQDPKAIIRQFKGPLLGVYGGKDLQVPGQVNADAFLQITLERNDAAARLFPEHNHLFQVAQTGAISEYEGLLPGPDSVVLREIADWLKVIG
jgi:uncharacterized protein